MKQATPAPEFCVFQLLPDSKCDTAAWERMAEGKWSGRANRHTVLNGDGEPTEKGWNLIETTGVTLKMLLSVHVQGELTYYDGLIYLCNLRLFCPLQAAP